MVKGLNVELDFRGMAIYFIYYHSMLYLKFLFFNIFNTLSKSVRTHIGSGGEKIRNMWRK